MPVVRRAVRSYAGHNVRALHEDRGYHAGPSELGRAAIKEAVRTSFDRTLDANAAFRSRLHDAETLHQSWLARSSLHKTS